MKIYLEDLKTEILESECDFTKGRIIGNEIKTPNGSEFQFVYKLYTKKELTEMEIEELKRWFEDEYRETFEKCIRRIQLKIKMSDGSDPSEVLNKFYLEAEEKANMIRQLENSIKGELNGSNNN